MVSTEELLPILKKILENQEKLSQEVEELRRKNQALTSEHKKAILHSISPKKMEEKEKEELLSSDLMEKCVDLILRDARRNPRFR